MATKHRFIFCAAHHKLISEHRTIEHVTREQSVDGWIHGLGNQPAITLNTHIMVRDRHYSQNLA